MKKCASLLATILSAFAVVVASSAAELCVFTWFHEDEMPSSLKAKIN